MGLNQHWRKSRRLGIGAVLLLALLFRATVPVGFMPSGEAPFALKICPDGMPSQAHGAHLHHGAAHGHFESCPFGSAPANGPVSASLGVAPPSPIASGDEPSVAVFRVSLRLQRAHAARGPPALI